MLADMAEMPRSALTPIHWEPQEGPRLPALLGRGASVSEGPGEPLQLSLVLALADLAVTPRAMACEEECLAPAAHEGPTWEGMAPLLVTRLLGWVPLPLPAPGRQTSESAWSISRDTYMRLTSSFRQMVSD